MQEQQQEAGGCKVLQFPGPEEAAGGGARAGGAVQRHHRYAWTSLSYHLEKSTSVSKKFYLFCIDLFNFVAFLWKNAEFYLQCCEREEDDGVQSAEKFLELYCIQTMELCCFLTLHLLFLK